MGLLYVRTGNNGGDAAFLIADLGYTIPTGSGWTLLSASSPEDADGNSGLFTAREIRDSADLYAAINGGQLEWSKDGVNEELGSDYVADFMLTQDFTDDFFDLGSGGLVVPHGAALPASGIEGQTYWKDGTDELYVWDNSDWRLINGSDADGLYEPTGFENRTDSTISFTSDTFTIQPVSSSYNIFFDGRQVVKDGSEQVALADTEGLHYIYFDYADDTLKETTSWSDDLIKRHVFAAAVYWDATTNSGLLVGDERHGITMDGDTHAYLHKVFGAQWVDGLALGNMSVDESGDDDTHAQFSVSDGDIADEDIVHVITDDDPQDLANTANIPIFYRSGASGDWRKKDADAFPLIYSGTAGYTGGSGLPPYNQWTGSTWQLTEVSNNDYVLVHYFATNDINTPVIGVQGQHVYATVVAAQNGATTELTSLVVDGLPTKEWVAIATVIYEVSTGHSNTPKARVISTADGDDYIDWRFTVVNPSGGVSTGDHGSLIGLADDDHPQYHDGSLAFTGDLNMGGNSISGVDLVDGVDVSTLYTNYTNHAADDTIHFPESGISHLNIQDIGANTHDDIDSHISDSTIHFTESSIDHDNIQNNGTYSHASIDSHIDDDSIHYPQSGIDHGVLQGLDDDDHTQYVLLSGDGTRNTITGKLNLSGGEFTVPQAANVAATFTSAVEGDLAWDTDDDALYMYDGAQWIVVATSSGVNTDHGAMTGLEDDDHPQYHDGSLAYTGDLNMGGNSISGVNLVDGVDVSSFYTAYTNHAADSTIHFTESSIDHDNIQNNGTYSHASIDSHIDDDSIHYPQSGIDHGVLQGLDDDDHTQYVSLTGDATRNAITGKLNLSGGQFRLPQAVDVASTFTSAEEGDMAWDSDDDTLWAYDGAEWFSIAPASGIITDHGALTGKLDDDHPQYTEWNNTETVSGLWTFDTADDDPAFVITPDVDAPTTNLADGAVSVIGGILYTYDATRSKWLSVDRKIVTAAKKGAVKNVYLRHADGIATSETGFRALRDGTITGITAQTDTAGTWTLEIRKNDGAAVITSLVMTAVQGNQDTTINVDFSQGDEIQFYANVSGTAVTSAIGAIEIAWRV